MSDNISYLGIDIGGTSVKYGMVSANGEIGRTASFSTGKNCSKNDFLQHLFAVIDEAARQEQLGGIGIACLGIVDSIKGQIVGGVNNLPIINNLNFKMLLQEKYPQLPFYICNDVKAAALGELWCGAGRNCDSFFCIAFGTGLGGAAVINGKVLLGKHYRAGEICYLDYRSSSDFCERYTSTKFVMEQAARQLGIDEINGIDFFARVRQNDPICLAVLQEWSERSARIIANLIVILDVEKIILGGGISPQLDLLIPLIEKSLKSMLPPEFYGQTQIAAAECGNNAALLGAVRGLLVAEK